MSSFDFSIEYRPGKKHGNADGMSRCPNEVEARASEARHYWLTWDLLQEGVLYRRFLKRNNTGSHLQLIVPRNGLSGHLGRKKT